MHMRYLRFIALFTLTPLPILAKGPGSESDVFVFALRAGIGFFAAIAIIFFIGGLIVYLTRLGTERRAEGIEIMGKATSVLIVVILATGLLRWLES